MEHKAKQDDEKTFAGSAFIDTDLVFCTNLGKPIGRRNFIRKFCQLIEDAGVAKTNFHAVRHYVESNIMGSEYGFPYIL